MACGSRFAEYLPSMSVPDIEGVKDDLEYVITDLDMSGKRETQR
jgi:hypothetical protein